MNFSLRNREKFLVTDDQPFCTEEMKRLKRVKSREYQKHRMSLKWQNVNEKYKKAVIKAKRAYYENIVKDLKMTKTSQWFSRLKKLCSYDQKKSEPVIVESIKHLSDAEQAEKIADKFSKVDQEYDPLLDDDIEIPKCDKKNCPPI